MITVIYLGGGRWIGISHHSYFMGLTIHTFRGVFCYTYVVMMRYWMIFLIVFTALVATYQAGSMIEVPLEEAEEFLAEFMAQFTELDGIGIFTHNAMLALVMFLPGFGPAFALFSSGSTGLAFSMINTVSMDTLGIPPLLLFLTPFGAMEILSYTLASTRGVILTLKLIQHEPLRSDMRRIIIEVGIVIGLLFSGGIIEDIMIQQITDGVPLQDLLWYD